MPSERPPADTIPAEFLRAVRDGIALVVERRLPAPAPEVVDMVTSWARAVRQTTSGVTRPRTLDQAAAVIAKRYGVSLADVRAVIEDVVAILHPTVGAAARIFGAEIESVAPLTPPPFSAVERERRRLRHLCPWLQVAEPIADLGSDVDTAPDAEDAEDEDPGAAVDG
jgi:hypothetical protein